MEFKAFEPGIEVLGKTLEFMVAGFRIAPSIGMRYLATYGLATPGPDGRPTFDVDAWYSQETSLDVFKAIYTEVGANTIFEIGRQLSLQGPFPSYAHTIVQAMEWLDTGYHAFHRKNGHVMFDAATGRMTDGIGHYGCRIEGEGRLVSECRNPYPCVFDFGILTGVGERFGRRAVVAHDDSAPCRKKGADACTYIITW